MCGQCVQPAPLAVMTCGAGTSVAARLGHSGKDNLVWFFVCGLPQTEFPSPNVFTSTPTSHFLLFFPALATQARNLCFGASFASGWGTAASGAVPPCRHQRCRCIAKTARRWSARHTRLWRPRTATLPSGTAQHNTPMHDAHWSARQYGALIVQPGHQDSDAVALVA